MAASGLVVSEAGDDGGDTLCHDFWCAIVSIADLLREGFGVFGHLLQLVMMAFSLLFDLVSALLRIISSVLDLILSLVNRLFGLVQTLSLAWNGAEPRFIPYLPTCQNPQSHAVCIGIWFLENTVLSTTFGRLIIPLFLSYAVTEWLEWLYSQLQSLLISLGKVA
jgi:hypothetical protein